MPIDDPIPLPEDDPDAELARRFGKGEAPLDRNSFEKALAQYKSAASETRPSPAVSGRVWQRIVPVVRGPIRVVPLWTRWVAAAAVILVAISTWFLFGRGPSVYSRAGAEMATVTLEDGSMVTLRPRSTLYRVDADSYLLEGEAFFSVVSASNRTFRVRSTVGEVRVLGTRFDVSTWGDQTAVFLERGRIAFEHAATGSVDTLSPGSELIATANERFVRIAPLDGQGSLDWLNGALHLGERPVSSILAELEHHFGITVVVPDAIKNETLSGQILLSSPEQSLSDLGTALGAQFEQTRPNVFRFSIE